MTVKRLDENLAAMINDGEVESEEQIRKEMKALQAMKQEKGAPGLTPEEGKFRRSQIYLNTSTPDVLPCDRYKQHIDIYGIYANIS